MYFPLLRQTLHDARISHMGHTALCLLYKSDQDRHIYSTEYLSIRHFSPCPLRQIWSKEVSSAGNIGGFIFWPLARLRLCRASPPNTIIINNIIILVINMITISTTTHFQYDILLPQFKLKRPHKNSQLQNLPLNFTIGFNTSKLRSYILSKRYQLAQAR